MVVDQTTLVDVVTKSIETRQTVVSVLLGVIGFILGKSWRDQQGQLDRGVFRRLAASIVLAAGSLVVVFYEQRRLLQAVSRDAFPAFATHWLNCGEPVLDGLIVLTALALLIGAW